MKAWFLITIILYYHYYYYLHMILKAKDWLGLPSFKTPFLAGHFFIYPYVSEILL